MKADKFIHLLADEGWKSRKLWFGVWATVLLFAGMKFAALDPATGPLYGEFVGGLVGIVTIVLGGHVAGSWVAGDTAKKLGASAEESTVPAPKVPAKPVGGSADVD